MQRLCLVMFCGVLLAGCPPGGEPDAGSRCPSGEIGCACGVDDACDADLVCSNGVCQPCTEDIPACAPGCEAGTLDCVCGPAETCGAGLQCQGNVCVSAPGCTPGTVDCQCQEGACDTGLSCTDGTCRPCTAETCPDTGEGCDGGSCQVRVTCATLPTPCAPGETCVEATPTADAYCAAQTCPACTGVGVVEGPGIKLASGGCICQTQPGFFYSESGSRGAVPCDADRDGWVRTAARFYINHSDPTLRENARCDLRVINQFVLHNEQGQSLAVGLTTPLPLYETVRNDDQFALNSAPANYVPVYGTIRRLRASELNSLTKACAGAAADHNHNQIADIAEWGRQTNFTQSPVGESPEITGELRSYFEVYTRFAYFLELNRGWFEPGIAGAPGSYHVQEKERTLSSGSGFPLRYGYEPGPTPVRTSNYWQECRRARDSWYSSEKPPIGMDYASLMGPPGFWKGMTHHSQFKCVQVVEDTTYALLDQAANRFVQTVSTLGDPGQELPKTGCDGAMGCVCRQTAPQCNVGLDCQASPHTASGICQVRPEDHLRATVNVCGLTAEEGAPTRGEFNPREPAITCQPSLPGPEHNLSTVWAAVRLMDSSQYARGCIVQCAGSAFLCPGSDTGECTAMCADFVSSELTPLGGGAQPMSVFGEVPFEARTQTVLQGTRFRLSPR